MSTKNGGRTWDGGGKGGNVVDLWEDCDLSTFAFKVWAANIGTTDFGQSLSLTDDDIILDGLEPNSQSLSSNNGADVEYDVGLKRVTFQAPDPWNTVKSFQLEGEKAALCGKLLEVKGFVHTDITLTGGYDKGTRISIDGAKRGKIITGDGKDQICLGITSNGGEDWDQTFNIDTGTGNDKVMVIPALDPGLAGNYTDGSTTTIIANLCFGRDMFDSTCVKSSDRVFGGGDNDTILSGDGDDRIHGQDGNDYLDAGDGNDVIRGGEGNDTIIGGLGYDEVDAEGGKDILIFGPSEFDFDVIYNFEAGIDVVDISNMGITQTQLDSNNDNIIDASDDLVSVQGTALNVEVGSSTIQFKATNALDVADFVFA